MSLSLMMAATVENSVIITHGPIGCGAAMHSLVPQTNKGKARRGKAPNPFVWLTTNLKESEVIGGGEQNLLETIIYADREFRPELIFVVTTCAPSIIGDDVEEIIRQAQKGVTAQIASLSCPGFKSRIVASAYDAFYHSLLKYVQLDPIPYVDYTPIEPSDPDYDMKIARFNYQKKMTVNIFNATSIGPDDEAELIRLLSGIGLTVRVYAEYCSASELRMISMAGLNVSMCDVHDDYILGYLKEKYDIPYIIGGMPLGFISTEVWLWGIARHFGLEAKALALIADEERQIKEAIEPLLSQVKGKRVLLCGGVVRSGAEAIMLDELGLEIVSVRAYHYDNGAEHIWEDVAEHFPELPVSVSNQIFELVNQVKRYKPDIVISHSGTHGWLAKIGATSMHLFDVDRQFFGYSGIFRVLQRLVFALKNTSYQDRLSKFIKMPYKEGWLEKNPFHYIKD
jgi:nitrogenase molybdenum-iron protein alpha chain